MRFVLKIAVVILSLFLTSCSLFCSCRTVAKIPQYDTSKYGTYSDTGNGSR
ncbi:MAG: hypothetical protein N2745_00585 [Syntrophorhabdaceae bacterium]|nr:hypothetical protein [Syntrophorhabdaceae bacterium]